MLDKNAGKALEIIGQTVDQGQQLGELLDQLIEYWRDLMVVQCTGEEKQILSVTGPHCQVLKQQAGRLKPDTVLAGLDILATARTRLRSTSQGRVMVEMALVRLSRLEDLVSLSQLAQWAASREAPLTESTCGSSGCRGAPKFTPAGQCARKFPPAESEKKKEPAVTTSPSSPDAAALDPGIPDAIWPQVISEAGFASKKTFEKRK